MNWYGHVQSMTEEKFWCGNNLEEEKEDLEIRGCRE